MRGLHIAVIIFMALFTFPAYSNIHKPSPVVTNYNKGDYNAAAQNWSVASDSDGIVYFANNDGLLFYDGLSWKIFTDNRISRIKSLLYCDDVLYCGGFQEFGFYRNNSHGSFDYTSLSSELEGWEMKNDEIWTILDLGSRIFFHSFTSAFIYDKISGKVSALPLDSFTESISLSHDGKLFTSAGLFSILDPETGINSPVSGCPFKSRMISSLPLGDSDLLITLSDGIWSFDGKKFKRFHTQADDWLASCGVNRAMLSSGRIYIGSTQKGCICLDMDGHLVWNADAPRQLYNATILGIGTDYEGNVWLALDSGLSCIYDNDNLLTIKSFNPPVGAIYSVFQDYPYIYLGTNKGLYVSVMDKDGSLGPCRQEKIIEGNVWDISAFDGQIICGTNTGTYELSEGRVKTLLSDIDGGYCIAKGIIHGREVLVQGTYTSLCIYVRQDGIWTFYGTVGGFIEPIDSIDVDFMGNIWAGHNSYGLFRISLDRDLGTTATVIRYDSLSDSMPKCKISVNRVFGRTVFSDGQRAYTYNDMNDSIVPFDLLNDALGDFAGARYICNSPDEKAWFIRDNQCAKVDLSQKDTVRLVSVVSDRLMGGHYADNRHNVTFTPDGTSIFALDNALGFVSDSYKGPDMTKNSLKIRSVTLWTKDESESVQVNLTDKEPRIDNRFRLITVEYVCPHYSTASKTSYSYKLEGRDNVWTDVGALEQINLNWLKPGNYKLLIEASSGEINENDIVEWSFRIKPPFYQSLLAKLFYLLMIVGFIVAIIGMILRYTNRKAEILQRENLENEIKAKSKLIASTTMNLIRKNEILAQIRNEVTDQKKELGDAFPDRYYRRMLNSIDSHISSEEDWDIFQHNFDRIHSGFFHILKERYPSLTSTDLRFCAYLCLNMTSKDIAAMMNISLKGVEAARYRIRKKVGLDSSVSLTDFLMNLQ